MASQRIMSFTKLALAQFVETYGVLKEQKGFEGPSTDALFEMLAEEIIGEPLTMKECSPRVDEVEQPAKAIGDAGVPVGNDEEHPVEKEPTPQETEGAPAPTQAVSHEKIPAKELKKLTVKQTKTVQKGEHKGETKEVDVMVELPYLPHCVDYSDTCQAIKCNGGLMTPCLTRPAKGSSYCRICAKDLKYGTVADREAAKIGTYQVTCESGEKSQVKREITYGTWLMKRSMERSFVETLLEEKFGDAITIPESYFEVNKSKARRGVKKSPSVSSDGETSSVDEETASVESVQSAESVQKKRGRPKKEKSASAEETPKKRRGRPAAPKKPIVCEDENDVVEEANEPEPEPVAEPEPEPVASADEQETQNVVVEEANEPEPEHVVESENAEPEPTPVEKSTTPVETDELNEDEISDDDSDEEGDETYFMYKGKQMCYDEENTLFMIENDEPTIVGTWDPETEKPVFDDGMEP
jgi:hypothetical protein